MTGKPKAHAECRLRQKPGICPRNIPRPTAEEQMGSSQSCITQCRMDSDCRQSDKCCNNGCADICVAPEPSVDIDQSYYYYHNNGTGTNVQQERNYYNYSGGDQNVNMVHPDDQYVYHTDNRRPLDEHDVIDEDVFEGDEIHYEQPNNPTVDNFHQKVDNQSNGASDNKVVARNGEDVVIQCPVLSELNELKVGTTTPIWSKDGQQIESVMETGRYELLANQSLLLRSVQLNDRGTFACAVQVLNEEQNYEMKAGYVQLEVHGKI